jgi:DNA repair protein RadA/Sms
MTDTGIEGLADPSGLFLSRAERTVPGTCVTVTVEGRRPLLAEVQALVAKSTLPSPRRAVSGLDAGRVAMVLAVTERRGGKLLGSNDVYTATVGGMRLTEPAADLALALAVASAVDDRPLPGDLIALGELGLSGELRPVPDLQRRLAEASRLGFRHAVVPLGSEAAGDMRLTPVSDLGQALVALDNMRRPRPPRTVGLTLAAPVTLP